MAKPWSFGPFGRDVQLMGGEGRPNRNRATANSFASMLLWILRRRAVAPAASDAMLAYMARALNPPTKDENQITEFIGAALPPEAKLWSKAGWTSEVRHDAAYIELPSGKKWIVVILTRGAADDVKLLPAIAAKLLEELKEGCQLPVASCQLPVASLATGNGQRATGNFVLRSGTIVMTWWIWVLVAFLLLIIEFFTTTAHVGFFAVGAFLVAVLVSLDAGGPLWFQLVLFATSSVVLLVFVRPIVVKRLGLNKTQVVDQIAGAQAMALEAMDAEADGRAELRGTTWSARNVGATPIVRGQKCVVDRVVGLTLHVRAAS
jgi:membrane protein implicated in regulation of membrane protease activity